MSETPQQNEAQRYLDPAQSIGTRVTDLLGRMTLEEKAQQLTSHWVYEILSGRALDQAKMKEKLADGIGEITRIGGASTFDADEYIATANAIQKYLTTETRLKIPAIVHEECCSGFMTRGATLFPQSIGLGATWRADLVRRMGDTIRRQMRSVGAHHALAPVLDVTRDARWGRVEETLGEDPYLTANLGCAYIEGLQSDDLQNGIIATAKHFVGYGMSEGGMNWAPAHLGPRELRDTYLFPFEAAVRTAGLASVMNNYGELDGQPCASAPELFREILRDGWGFDGVVVSDYFAINMIKAYHGAARGKGHAAEQALAAGIDLELPTRDCYAEPLVEAVRSGSIPEHLVDEAVTHVLRMKFRLGLFENPFVPERTAGAVIYDTAQDRALAKELAAASLVLLKNDEETLPIATDARGPRKIAVIGPNADSWRNQIGDYAYPCHIETLKSMKEDDPFGTPVPDDVEEVDDDASVRTILEGIRACLQTSPAGDGTTGAGADASTDALPQITYARGCDVLDTDRSGFAEAVTVASDADLVILAMGDRAGLVEGCTTGEARDRATLGLPGVQEELLKEVAATGTPIVLVLLNGRPVALPEVEPLVKAILLAWLPGEEGGTAVAEALFGVTNPGGKLPISFPRDVGQVPVFYGHKPSGGRSHWLGSYVEMSTTPFYAFGHGLSYTSFSYDALTIEGKTLSQRDRLRLSVDITNTGQRDGEEVVQLYVRDEEYTITRPVKELKGFARIAIPAGDTRRVTFALSTDQLGFHGKDLDYIVEPGTFQIMVGSGSEDIRLTDTVEIVGDTRTVSERDAYFTRVVVDSRTAGADTHGDGAGEVQR